MRFSPGGVIGAHGGVTLRFVRDDDSAAIISLISSVWSEYPGKLLAAGRDMPELLAPWTSYAEGDGRFWVVEARGEIIGTVALKPNAHDPRIVELQKMYVAHSMRRNGLGSFLCSLVEREARERGSRAVELWSDIKLLDAHRHYRRYGFARGPELRFVADRSRTVQYYYSLDLTDALTAEPAIDATILQTLVASWAARGADLGTVAAEVRA
ncbi:MAG TPA: GNAT family N-acetyltransferase [Stellaceae bacterium]|nr:GNAT family N-acetyltransferase [Stellaceae bacterium]